MKKLAIITSHPIQYNAPLFRLLAERANIHLKVFYTWGQTEQGFVYDPDFQKEFKWDIPLLDGYEKEFVQNVAKNPGAGAFNGIQNNDLIDRIDSYNPDTLFVFGWSFKSHLQVLRHYKGKKKILFRGDSNLLDERLGISLKKIIRRWFLTWVCKHIDTALYTGNANKAYYQIHGLSKNQLVYAPHAIENKRFADADESHTIKANQWRAEMGIAATDLVFLFAGKLEPKKDPFFLINVFKTIPQKHIRLLLVGNGALEKNLKFAAQEDGRILFLDFQNQQLMPVVYRLGNVFVLPSKGPGETWGLSVNEAMACGLPVLVSDRCGCAKELVKDNGRVFEAENKKAFADALLFFINAGSQLAQMGAASYTSIQSFSFNQIAEVVEEAV